MHHSKKFSRHVIMIWFYRLFFHTGLEQYFSIQQKDIWHGTNASISNVSFQCIMYIILLSIKCIQVPIKCNMFFVNLSESSRFSAQSNNTKSTWIVCEILQIGIGCSIMLCRQFKSMQNASATICGYIIDCPLYLLFWMLVTMTDMYLPTTGV